MAQMPPSGLLSASIKVLTEIGSFDLLGSISGILVFRFHYRRVSFFFFLADVQVFFPSFLCWRFGGL